MRFELDVGAEFYQNPRYALLRERKVCQDAKNQDVHQAIGLQILNQSFKPTPLQLNAAWTTFLWGFHVLHPSISRCASIRSSSKGMPSLKTSSRPWSLRKEHQRHYLLELDVFCVHVHSAQYQKLGRAISLFHHGFTKQLSRQYLSDLCGKESWIKRPKVVYFLLTNDMHALVL